MCAAIDLVWLPLGAGGRCVPRCGRAYEAIAARRAGRRPLALHHSALLVRSGGATWVVEMAPAWSGPRGDRGVVATGSVGLPHAGRCALGRYEVRCWRDGVLPDLAFAAGRPRRVSTDPGAAAALLACLPAVPRLVWGRDELGCGDMWNSNSVVAWALASAGLDAANLRPPAGGRAPGWQAGLVACGFPVPAYGGGPMSPAPSGATLSA